MNEIKALCYTPVESRIHILLKNIYEEDADFIYENNLVLTLEQLTTSDFAIYLRHEDDEEDDELITISSGRRCEECIKELVDRYKEIHK